MICEVPPLKLTEIGGGGALDPPPHPERAAAKMKRYPFVVESDQRRRFGPRMVSLRGNFSSDPKRCYIAAWIHGVGDNSSGQLVVAPGAFAVSWRVAENCGSQTTSGEFAPVMVLL